MTETARAQELLCRSKEFAVSLEGGAVSLEGRQLAPSMPHILVDPDRRQHVLATHGHSHHRSTFLRRRCCPPTCQRHRHLPQLRQRAQRTAWTSLPGCRRLCHQGTPAFSSGSELQGRSHGLHPHIVNGLALAHCSTSSHHHVWMELSSGHTFDSPFIRAAQVRALGVRSFSSSSSSSSMAASQTVRSEDRTTAAADTQASSC